MTAWHTEQHHRWVLWKREVAWLVTAAPITTLRLNRENAMASHFLIQDPSPLHTSLYSKQQSDEMLPVWRKATNNFSSSLPMQPDVSGSPWCHFHTTVCAACPGQSSVWSRTGKPIQTNLPWKVFQHQNLQRNTELCSSWLENRSTVGRKELNI